MILLFRLVFAGVIITMRPIGLAMRVTMPVQLLGVFPGVTIARNACGNQSHRSKENKKASRQSHSKLEGWSPSTLTSILHQSNINFHFLPLPSWP
jgi:hypothetical protein